MRKTGIFALPTALKVSFSFSLYRKNRTRHYFITLRTLLCWKIVTYPIRATVDPRRHQSIALKCTFSYVKMYEESDSVIKIDKVELHLGETPAKRIRWWNLLETGIFVPPTALKVWNSNSWHRNTPENYILLHLKKNEKFTFWKNSDFSLFGLRYTPEGTNRLRPNVLRPM